MVAGAEMKGGSAGVGTREQEIWKFVNCQSCVHAKDFGPFDETTPWYEDSIML